MCVTLVGGMDRLKAEYMAAAREHGCSLRCVPRNERHFEGKIGNPDMLIIFTNKISHEAKRKASDLGRARGIPVCLAHSCGVSTLRDCIRQNKSQGMALKSLAKRF